MRLVLYKLKILFLRILGYEKPLRVALLKYLSLKFFTFRPHYETLMYETAKNALKLGCKEIDVIELGVAGGSGIQSLINYDSLSGAKSAYEASSVNLGRAEESVWTKKFKMRITSKHSGKKFDINLSCKTNLRKDTSASEQFSPASDPTKENEK